MEVNKLYDLQECILTDWSDIEEGIDRFYSEVSIRVSQKSNPREVPIKIPIRLSFAKALMDNTRTLLIDKINPIENEYLKSNMQYYNKMIENLGRVDWELKDASKELLEKTENIGLYSKDKTIPLKAAQFLSLLHRSHTIFIVNPLLNAAKRVRRYKLKNKDSEIKILIDENLFLYWVFIELFQSSESIGTITAQYPPGLARRGSITNPQIIQSATSPSEIPDSVKKIPGINDDISENEIDIFSDGGEDVYIP